MTLTLDQLKAAMPACADDRAQQFLAPLNAAIAAAEANTFDRLCMFLATIAHESFDLNVLEENLNYSAVALQRVWPSRFRLYQSSVIYERKPEKIANYVYALRGGNGDEASGDGWRFRGAGAIQLTFRVNHSACAKFFGKRLEDMAAWLRSPEGACMSAAWFWKTRGCNDFADHDDFDGVCDVVNIGRKTAPVGDAVGFVNRLAKLHSIRGALKK